MPGKIKTKKRKQNAAGTKCKVSSVFKGQDISKYTKNELRRYLEDNDFLKAKSPKDQNSFMDNVIPNIIKNATRNTNKEFPPYLKSSVICFRCLNNSKLHQIIYDNITLTYKIKNSMGKKEETPAADEEIKVRIKAIIDVIIFVLVPALKAYNEDSGKNSKTEDFLSKEFSEMIGVEFSLNSDTFAATEEASAALADQVFNNKDKIEDLYETKMFESIDRKSCNPNDEEDKEKCGELGKKNPGSFLYFVTGLFAFALVFEFAG